jgi:hypothetical protein
MTKPVPDSKRSSIFQLPPTRQRLSPQLSVSFPLLLQLPVTGFSLYYESFYFFVTETENHCSALKPRNDPLTLSKGLAVAITVCTVHEYAKLAGCCADYHSDGVIINSDHTFDPLHAQCYVLLPLS